MLICVPGQRLCLSNENTVAGQGTYDRQGYIYSLLAGVVEIVEKDKVNKLHIRNARTENNRLSFADKNHWSENRWKSNNCSDAWRHCNRTCHCFESTICKMRHYVHRWCDFESCISWHFAKRRCSSWAKRRSRNVQILPSRRHNFGASCKSMNKLRFVIGVDEHLFLLLLVNFSCHKMSCIAINWAQPKMSLALSLRSLPSLEHMAYQWFQSVGQRCNVPKHWPKNHEKWLKLYQKVLSKKWQAIKVKLLNWFPFKQISFLFCLLFFFSPEKWIKDTIRCRVKTFDGNEECDDKRELRSQDSSRNDL